MCTRKQETHKNKIGNDRQVADNLNKTVFQDRNRDLAKLSMFSQKIIRSKLVENKDGGRERERDYTEQT
jgi:hypothetical protein